MNDRGLVIIEYQRALHRFAVRRCRFEPRRQRQRFAESGIRPLMRLQIRAPHLLDSALLRQHGIGTSVERFEPSPPCIGSGLPLACFGDGIDRIEIALGGNLAFDPFAIQPGERRCVSTGRRWPAARCGGGCCARARCRSAACSGWVGRYFQRLAYLKLLRCRKLVIAGKDHERHRAAEVLARNAAEGFPGRDHVRRMFGTEIGDRIGACLIQQVFCRGIVGVGCQQALQVLAGACVVAGFENLHDLLDRQHRFALGLGCGSNDRPADRRFRWRCLDYRFGAGNEQHQQNGQCLAG